MYSVKQVFKRIFLQQYSDSMLQITENTWKKENPFLE